MTQDVDVQGRDLLKRIRTHQASIDTYVRKTQRRRDLVANISIFSSAIAAALVVGPTVGGVTFAETVQRGLSLEKSSIVWRLLCLTSLIVNLAAAISAQLGKSNDPTERIKIAETCNAELEGLRAKVEFGDMPVSAAVGEYGQIVVKALFVPRNLANDVDSEDGTNAPTPSRYRIAEVALPGTAIAFGCVVVVMTVIGLLLGQGKGVAADPPRLVLSPSQVKISDNYLIAASGFSPGEDVQLSWAGPINGTMGVFHATFGVFRADTSGNTTYGAKIVDKTLPGTYAITAIGLTSKQTVQNQLVVQSDN